MLTTPWSVGHAERCSGVEKISARMFAFVARLGMANERQEMGIFF